MTEPSREQPDFTLALPSGEIVRGRHGITMIVGGYFVRYERREGQIYSVLYRIFPTDSPTHFSVEEEFAYAYNGVL